MTARRTLLALGSAAIAAPSLPVLAIPPRVGRAEAIFREAAAVSKKRAVLRDAWALETPRSERARTLGDAIDEADEHRYRLIDAAILTPIETVTDALLVIAAAAYEGRIATEGDFTDLGADRFLRISQASRRAAEFLAAHLGCDITPVSGQDFDMGEALA